MSDNRSWRVRPPGGNAIGPYDPDTLSNMVAKGQIRADWMARDAAGRMMRVSEVIGSVADSVPPVDAAPSRPQSDPVVQTTHSAGDHLEAWAVVAVVIAAAGFLIGLVALSIEPLFGSGFAIAGGLVLACGLFLYAILHGGAALLHCSAEILAALQRDARSESAEQHR